MKLKVEFNNIDWWLWAITFVFISVALMGWTYAYILVIFISAFQIAFIGLREKSIIAFETQVRILYFIFTLTGLIENLRFTFYIFLLLGTIMVVFFGKCSIAMFLRVMPWNKKNDVCSLEKN